MTKSDTQEAKGRGRRIRRAWIALALAGTLTASAAPTPATAADDPVPGLDTTVITADGADAYDIRRHGSGLTVSAPATNQSANLRMVGVANDAPLAVNQRSCLTWEGPAHGPTQPGLALRVRGDAQHSQAITITDNIWMANRNTLNVHLVNSAAPPGEEITFVGSVPLPLALGPAPVFSAPLPWRLCARVHDRTVEVVAYPRTAAFESPPWGDESYSGTVEVPEDWVYTGQPGWYAGHIPAGDETRYTELETAAPRQLVAALVLRSSRWLGHVGTLTRQDTT
ncbi:hypothetical protein BH23ACT2_BH23ACT2_17610 [soil metagenome]